MFINSNFSNILKLHGKQNNSTGLRTRQYGCDVVSFKANELKGNALVERFELLANESNMPRKGGRISYNREVFKAKAALLHAILEEIPGKWSGLRKIVSSEKKCVHGQYDEGLGMDYDADNLAERLGINKEYSESWQRFLEPARHSRGEFECTENIVMPILNTLGLTEDTRFKVLTDKFKRKSKTSQKS